MMPITAEPIPLEDAGGKTYRVLALDLDGTALDEDYNIPPQLGRRLAGLQEQGCQVVLASGRMVASMARYARQIGLEGPGIAYNGAVIARLPQGTVLAETPVPQGVARELCRFCRDEGLYVQLYHEDRVYTRDRSHPEAQRYEVISGRPVQEMGEAVYRPNFAPTKLLIVAPEHTMRHLQPAVQQRFGTQIHAATSYPFYLEIVAPGVNKGRALAAVCEELDVPLSEVAAVGDGANDVALLERAGLGIAVEGAHVDLLGAADAVAPAPGPAGVLAVLETLWP